MTIVNGWFRVVQTFFGWVAHFFSRTLANRVIGTLDGHKKKCEESRNKASESFPKLISKNRLGASRGSQRSWNQKGWV